MRRAGYEVKQFDGHILFEGQHTSNEALIALALEQKLIDPAALTQAT